MAHLRAAPDEPCPNPFYNPFVPNVARVLVWSERYRDPSGSLPDLELQVFRPLEIRLVVIANDAIPKYNGK
jgi:hypothetical protein